MPKRNQPRYPRTARVNELLRRETVGGALLVVAATVALVWANSPWSDGYAAMRDAQIGPAALHLHLSLGAWAADGLLAIFFFVAGLELKREFVAGDLRDVRRAALPVAAAVGALVSVPVAAAAFTLLFAIGGTVPVETSTVFAAMVGWHTLIGIGEALGERGADPGGCSGDQHLLAVE